MLGHVLIADDELGCRTVTAQVLRRAGYECETAADASEAAKLLAEHEYDLLISDLEMPGNQDLRLIRQVPQMVAGLPVILMTAYPTMETAIQSLELAVTAYLVKPFSQEQLLEKVGRAVQHYQAYRALRVNRQRIEEWSQTLEQIEASLKLARQSAAGQWQSLLDLTLHNVSGALADLRVFAEVAARQPASETQDGPLDSTRSLLLFNALRETIAVLERTRSSFKSKDLGELRRKLERLLEAKPESSRNARRP